MKNQFIELFSSTKNKKLFLNIICKNIYIKSFYFLKVGLVNGEFVLGKGGDLL